MIFFQRFSQRGQLFVFDEAAPKIKRLRSKQGKRTSCFKERGGQFVKLITAQGLSPARPVFAR